MPETQLLDHDPAETIDSQWGDATVEVIHAQIAYARLASRDAADDAAVVAAWLRLWRAQERQRRLSKQIEQIEP